ncbi:MAG: ADP-heptose synthase [Verrucomicrobiales bacterium]|nr:ADP-heptose synthase [Verrucomicrobiales bacterium]
MTNGCFDILHAGHVVYLDAASAEGDVLLVGLNGDASVRELKGEGRPVNPESDRATVLAGLASVGAVTVFVELDALRLLEIAKPDVYVKGGDYTLESINQPERRLVEEQGGKVVILPGVEGRSTTAILDRAGGS